MTKPSREDILMISEKEKAPKAFILDGYVDEPACLGVSPYISPYIRYCAGVCSEYGYAVTYATIDSLRDAKNTNLLMREIETSDLFIFIAGVTVPGKYLGGIPANASEIYQIGMSITHPLKCLGGPVVFGSASQGGMRAKNENFSVYDFILKGEYADALSHVLEDYGGVVGDNGRECEWNRDRKHGTIITGKLDYSRIDSWSVLGSGVIRQHPSFPNVICELETARGCSRAAVGGCSFCTEYLYGMPQYRKCEGVFAEVKALYESGARAFRLGRQPDLLAYNAASNMGIAKPNPDAIEKLFEGIRKSAPNLSVLHIDNINPATIAAYPEESKAALSSIVKYHTAGDTAAFGLESADPNVVRANNLKAYADDVFEAVKIVNEVGGVRDENGVPHILPGINFVTGLMGETAETYRLNLEFLRRIYREDLMVRRVNIRQVMPFEDTKAYENNTLGKFDKNFKEFKETVRKEFDSPMLNKVFPRGTVLKDAVVEVSGDISFARQLGSYPILIGIPYRLPIGYLGDFFVTDWGYRSVTAFEKPFKINTAGTKLIGKLPGLSKKAAVDLFVKRPILDPKQFEKIAGKQFYSGYIDYSP